MTAPVLAVLLAASAGVSASTAAAAGGSGRTAVPDAQAASGAGGSGRTAVPDAQAASGAISEPFLVDAAVPVTLEAVLAQFRRFDAKILTLTADFAQSLEMTDSPMRQKVQGTISYRKPDRLRIEHQKPERQTVVSDGLDIWIHRHDRRQVVQAKLSDWRAADPTLDNLLRFGRYAEMLETYAVALDTASARPALTLTPKDSDSPAFSLILSLSSTTLFPESAELTAGAARMRTEFSRIVFNPDIEAGAFAFTPPPDADVFRNFKPPRFAP
ncbi:MAG: hypothetical protein CO113_12340 [Elusimicrobia bacterium CG_4_9_14_3_um_filter_62_55]|nr:MAG: hypothetical protein CO113_12340 [Elusimicrobia bacterium CG_4_9_14_3_um_filter_62_55]